MEAKTGKVLSAASNFPNNPVIAVDGTLIGPDAGGNIQQVAMSPAGYKELGRIADFKGGWTAPVVADKKIDPSRNNAEIACFDLQ